MERQGRCAADVLQRGTSGENFMRRQDRSGLIAPSARRGLGGQLQVEVRVIDDRQLVRMMRLHVDRMQRYGGLRTIEANVQVRIAHTYDYQQCTEHCQHSLRQTMGIRLHGGECSVIHH